MRPGLLLLMMIWLAASTEVALAQMQPRTPGPITRETILGRPAAVSGENNLQAFVERDFLQGDVSNPEHFAIYSDMVEYYGKPTSVWDIASDKREYFARWTRADYRIVPGSFTAVESQRSPAQFLISFLLDFDVEGEKRSASGRALTHLTVTYEDGHPRIVAEDSSVVERR